MKAARQTSLTLLGTTTTNCFNASGTAKLSDWLAESGVAAEVGAGSDTLMLAGSFKHTSAKRVTSETHQDAMSSPSQSEDRVWACWRTACERRRQQDVLTARSCRVQTVQDDGQIFLKAHVQRPEDERREDGGVKVSKTNVSSTRSSSGLDSGSSAVHPQTAKLNCLLS